MYANGQGVARDNLRASMWLSIAASNKTFVGDRNALIGNRDAIAALLTPRQMEESQRLTKTCNANQLKGC